MAVHPEGKSYELSRKAIRASFLTFLSIYLHILVHRNEVLLKFMRFHPNPADSAEHS